MYTDLPVPPIFPPRFDRNCYVRKDAFCWILKITANEAQGTVSPELQTIDEQVSKAGVSNLFSSYFVSARQMCVQIPPAGSNVFDP